MHRQKRVAAIHDFLLCGHDLHSGIQKAVAFTCDAIRRTGRVTSDPRCGVNFEAGLADIVRLRKNNE